MYFFLQTGARRVARREKYGGRWVLGSSLDTNEPFVNQDPGLPPSPSRRPVAFTGRGAVCFGLAAGISSDLISRAADVVLKERRKLIVVPRETPLGEIHLRNMLTITQAGAVVLPAMPGFYHHPQRISDLVDMVVSRILDQLGIDNQIFKRWQGEGVSKFLAIDTDAGE